MDHSDYLPSFEIATIGRHPGYIDAELLKLATLSLEICRDAEMYMSEEIKRWIEDNHIALITYYDSMNL